MKSNEYLIIGHAYGNHSGSNKGISDKVLKYFESLDKKNNIILTGDFVRSGSKEDLLLVKKQVESYFKTGMFAVGNHEIKTNQNNYYDVFENDLFMISENKVDLVVANFSTINWLPKISDQKCPKSRCVWAVLLQTLSEYEISEYVMSAYEICEYGNI